jgi:hypothetical protein
MWLKGKIISSDTVFNEVYSALKKAGIVDAYVPESTTLGTHINELIRLIGWDLQWSNHRLGWLKQAADFYDKRNQIVYSLNGVEVKVDALIKAMKEHNETIKSFGEPFDTWGHEFIKDLGILEETKDEIIKSASKVLSLREPEPEEIESEEKETKADVFHETGIIPWITPSTEEK